MRPGSIIMSQRISSKLPECRAGVSEAKEVPNATLCWQGDGNCILGCTRCYYVGLSSKEKYNNRCVLCKIVWLRIVIRGKLSKGILLQQDNARVHTCKIAMDAVERNGYKLIRHPAYSPELAPSDYFLFPNLKKDIRVCLFVLRFYGPVNPMGSCWAWSVYLTTLLLSRLSPLSS